MEVTENTKIAALIKENPEVIEAIASIAKHFEKLRNPLLRKILASRVTIKEAAAIGKTDVQTFFEKLTPLGFSCKLSSDTITEKTDSAPDFYTHLKEAYIISLDVRDDILNGQDPFGKIIKTLSEMPEGYILRLINSFEPIPLINILSKKGYSHYTVQKKNSLVFTYLKPGSKGTNVESSDENYIVSGAEIEKTLLGFGAKIQTIDVRNLEMPLPMITILNTLETMPEDTCLYVHHKKIPRYLIPEIAERGFQLQIQEIKEGNVKLLIFK